MANLDRTKISIITPSFNQAAFLEQTILSVIGQHYPNLEYIVMDGGSRDGSVDIIRKYEKHLAYWTSVGTKGPLVPPAMPAAEHGLEALPALPTYSR